MLAPVVFLSWRETGRKMVDKVSGGGDAGIAAKLTRSAHFPSGCCVMLVVVVL